MAMKIENIVTGLYWLTLLLVIGLAQLWNAVVLWFLLGWFAGSWGASLSYVEAWGLWLIVSLVRMRYRPESDELDVLLGTLIEVGIALGILLAGWVALWLPV